ncbi:hypothetical protein SynMITS9220_00873 [Synechococcus sp. MIT S9220]|nr:hypothetical protein SynMITS9220_00873 [Synechococcus sp. MIT S9220]
MYWLFSMRSNAMVPNFLDHFFGAYSVSILRCHLDNSIDIDAL